MQCQLGSAQNEPYLGPIAMGDDHVPTLLDHAGDMLL